MSEYPYIVSESGKFIDANYPNLASPEYIVVGASVTVGNTVVQGTNTFKKGGTNYGRYPYTTTEIGGVSFPPYSITLPNCTAYVSARWQQLSGGTIVLRGGYGNAGDWYTSSGLSKYRSTDSSQNQTPKLGAIACWGGGTYGHVAVVERILPNGDFYVAESGLPSSELEIPLRMRWNTDKQRRGVHIQLCKRDGRGYKGWGKATGRNFQGFLYYPNDYFGSGTGSSAGGSLTRVWQPLYSEPTERTDATVRTVGYLSNDYSVTSKSNPFQQSPQVAAINYTPVLQAIYNYNKLGYTNIIDNSFTNGLTNVDFDTSGCGGVYQRQEVVNCLLKYGLSRAQVAGICGNIYQESRYRSWSVEGDYLSKPYPDSVNTRNRSMDSLSVVEHIKTNPKYAGNHGIGLLAWTYPPFEISMVAYCEKVCNKPWYTTVEGQIDFFMKVQLGGEKWQYSNYASTDGGLQQILNKISGFPDTVDGAKQICKLFMDLYERPSKPKLEARYAETEFVFNHIIPYQVKNK